MNLSPEKKLIIYRGFGVVILAFIIAVGVSLLTEIVRSESNQPHATISFSGHGEVTATPDIANIYFTINKDASTIKDAQAGVATIEKSALDVLKAKGILDKDIQTADASFNPKYEYRQGVCPIAPPTPLGGGVASTTYCNPGKQVLVGYTASESITVKVRNTDTVGDIMQSLGTTGVTNLSGPNFTIDNQDALQIQARQKAIDDAKTKAEVLAKELGVTLGKISSFNDSSTNYPRVYTMDANVMPIQSATPTASIPKGENTITSDVTITYEIK